MESKEKKVLKVNFAGSGVKTLSVLLYVMHFFTIILLFVVILMAAAYVGNGTDVLGPILMAAASCLMFLFLWGLCMALSSIAKTNLYKRAIIENEYKIEKI